MFESYVLGKNKLYCCAKILNDNHGRIFKVLAYYQQRKAELKNTKTNMQTSNESASINQSLPAIGAHILPQPLSTSLSKYDINIKFQDNLPPISNRQLKDLINDRIINKEYFYGIEITAKNYDPHTILDYRSFGATLPLFTSLVWLSAEYWNVKHIEEVESIQYARKLSPHTIVLPHLSCYHLNQQRVHEFLNLNFSNVLAVRGDNFEPDQQYKHSSELVENIRQLRGDAITIGVAGYPEGHPECTSIEEDLNNLKKKVTAGADFIITQICFSAEAIIDFVKSCRAKGIKIPIIVGILVPDNLRTLQAMLRITKIKIAEEDLKAYENQNALGHANFTSFAIQKASQMIESVFASEIDVYGLQFFTVNKFKNIPKVLDKINKKFIFK